MADAPEVVPDTLHPPDEKQHLGRDSPVAPESPEKQNPELLEQEHTQQGDDEETSPKHVVSNDDTIRRNDTVNEVTSPKLVVSQLDDATGLQVVARKSNDSPQAIEGSNTAAEPGKAEGTKTPAGYANKYAVEEAEWQTEFWSCKDSGELCVESITCPCILAGRTNTRLHDPEATHLPSTNVYCASCFALSLTTIGALPLFCFMTTATRREVRYRYHIKGNHFSDCWKATFFPCCALVQEEREVLYQLGKAREDLGYGKRDDKMEYKP